MATQAILTPILAQRYGALEQIDEQEHPDNGLLIRAIFENCIESQPSIDSHCIFRKVALTVSIAASLGANAAFTPISLNLPGGPFFATTNFIGFFKLDIWAIRAIIHELLGPKGDHERALISRSSQGCCYTTSVLTTSFALSLLTQVPVALPALKYDGKFKYPAVAALFAGGTLIPVSSLKQSFDHAVRARGCRTSQNEKSLEQVRSALVSAVSQYRESFVTLGIDEKLDLIEDFRQQREQGDGNEAIQVDALISSILTVPETPPPTCGSSVVKGFSTAVGGAIALSLQAGLAWYTYSTTKEYVYDDNVFAGVSAGLTVLSGSYLATQSIVGTVQRIASSSLNCITRQSKKSLAEQLRPKLTLSLKLLGLVVDLGALGATVVIWDDFTGKNLPAKIYFETTLCLAYFLFLSSASLDAVDGAIEELVQRKGTPDEQQIMLLNNQLKKLEQLIQSSSLLDFGQSLGQLSDTTRENLLLRANTTVDKIEDHLEHLA